MFHDTYIIQSFLTFFRVTRPVYFTLGAIYRIRYKDKATGRVISRTNLKARAIFHKRYSILSVENC